MSRIFGDMRQLAFVTTDIDQVMNHWTQTMGVGPFFIKRRLRFDPFIYYGKTCASPEISIALAHSGGVQIELIQQHDDRPSVYRDFLRSQGQGIQHVAAWYETAAMFVRKKELVGRGFCLAQECVIPSSGVNLAYFDTRRGDQHILFELADLMQAEHLQRIKSIADAAHGWDGSDPIREVTK